MNVNSDVWKTANLRRRYSSIAAVAAICVCAAFIQLALIMMAKHKPIDVIVLFWCSAVFMGLVAVLHSFLFLGFRSRFLVGVLLENGKLTVNDRSGRQHQLEAQDVRPLFGSLRLQLVSPEKRIYMLLPITVGGAWRLLALDPEKFCVVNGDLSRKND